VPPRRFAPPDGVTVIGGVVNISWKLQELTKQLGCDLIVSRNVRALLVEDDLESRGLATLPGQTEPLEVFAVLGAVDLSALSSLT